MDMGLLRQVLASRSRRFRAAHDPMGCERIKRQAETVRRCTVCGHRGATLQHPGWVDTVVGFQQFPVSNDILGALGIFD
jgi:hypothetical protein